MPIAFHGVVRVAGVTHPSYTEWPFPKLATYDPYGELREAGESGPYYR